LRYERYRECNPAVDKGKQTKINIMDFCKDSLQRKFGEDWFNKLKEVVKK